MGIVESITLIVVALIGSVVTSVISILVGRKKEERARKQEKADFEDKLTADLDDEREKRRALEKRFDEERQCRRDLEGEISELKELNKTLTVKVNKLEAAEMEKEKVNAALLKQVDMLQERVSVLEAENTKLIEENKEIPKLRERIAALEAENERLKGDK